MRGGVLAVQDSAALRLLTQTSRLSASLSIVTLSVRPWVATSARRWLPRTADFLEKWAVPVYYAREHVTARDLRLAATDDCQSLGTLAKRRGMEQSLDDQAAEGRIVVVSIGDGDWEKYAAQVLAWRREGAVCRVIRVRPPRGRHLSLFAAAVGGRVPRAAPGRRGRRRNRRRPLRRPPALVAVVDPGRPRPRPVHLGGGGRRPRRGGGHRDPGTWP